MVADPVFRDSFNRFYSDFRHCAVDIKGRNFHCSLTAMESIPRISDYGFRMAKQRFSPDQNVIPFPDNGTLLGYRDESHSLSPAAASIGVYPASSVRSHYDIVLSGTYRKGVDALKRTYEEFKDLGCDILSPSNLSMVKEIDGFVYMRGEENETPEVIESRHLEAIQKANFVWLHAPEGYVGPTAALEIGFAHAAGVPVFTREIPTDKVLQSLVSVVQSPAAIVQASPLHIKPPAPALRAFQEYYKRAAIQRGYNKEGPKECLLLMVEEVGELARAIRKREKLVRHGSYSGVAEAHELADVFLYVVHMANVLGLDLGGIVQEKEFINVGKFLAK